MNTKIQTVLTSKPQRKTFFWRLSLILFQEGEKVLFNSLSCVHKVSQISINFLKMGKLLEPSQSPLVGELLIMNIKI